MEPVTHLLTGACLARAGCNRRAAYATATMVVAAELPDIDTVWGWRGPVEGFVHHRGITHTFLGVPFEAALLVAAAYGVHRWRVSRRKQGTRPLTKAPARWGELYGYALLALLSHLLLDYTNNYGLRPFFPFDRHWYAASIVFIFDPLIFGLLVGALVLPSLFGLVGAEVGARRQPFRGRGLAVAALLGVVGWWTLREVEHNRATGLAMQQSLLQPQMPPRVVCAGDTDCDTQPEEGPPKVLTAQRVLASPHPVNPFDWSVATDFGPVYQLSEVNVRTGAVVPDQTLYSKPGHDWATMAAEASALGRAYIDWSPMPIVMPETSTLSGGPNAEPLATTVTFSDPRFMGDDVWYHLRGAAPLTGEVTLDSQGKAVRQELDGRVEP